MTIEQFCTKYMTDNDLFPEDAAAVIAAIKADTQRYSSLIEIFDKRVNGYPAMVRVTSAMLVKRAAFEWLKANKPTHRAIPMFASNTEIQNLKDVTLNNIADGPPKTKIGLELARRKYGLIATYIDSEYAPTQEQWRKLATDLGIPTRQIHDSIELDIPEDKADTVSAELQRIYRENEAAAGAKKDVTERPDRFEPQ